MKINIKTPDEIELMRVAGRKAAAVLDYVSEHVREGVSTNYLNELCHKHITENLKCTPAPLNYKGFPKSICTSVNDEVCHGIPSDRLLCDGDILNIDVTVIHEEYHGDTSRMFIVGDAVIESKRLVAATRICMLRGIETVAPGKYFSDIGTAIQDVASMLNYSVVREYGGHGIGKIFHDDPPVLHYHQAARGPIMLPGMTFTVEPMINAGCKEIKLLDDGWTVVTADGSMSAQWEHTVLVTEKGFEILTQ